MPDALDFVHARSIQVGGTTTPGTGAIVACAGDGWVRLILASNDTIDIYAQTGLTYVQRAQVKGVATTAAFTPLATNVVVNVVDA